MREFADVPVRWCELKDLPSASPFERRLIICWNEPDTMEYARSDKWCKNDILVQKLTSFSKGDSKQNWGDNPLEFFRNWTWPLYKRFEKLVDSGLNIYAFGCKTDITISPEKERICRKLQERIHWIPWGTTLFTKTHLQKKNPVFMEEFPLDVGWVGSKWGKAGRGNVDAWEQKIVPILEKLSAQRSNRFYFAGKGHANPPVSNQFHEIIIRNSRLCPILNAPSWVAEKGVQDRFWSVFACGRFGVCDSEGVYEFFDESKVVAATGNEEYIDKSLFYYASPKRQMPYIEHIQQRIKAEYNFHDTWKKIIKKINADLDAGFFISRPEKKLPNYEERFNATKANLKATKCIVMGNGPSLSSADIERLKKFDTISFNRAYIAYEEWRFAPTYYMVIDPRVLENCASDIDQLIDKMPRTTFFLRNLTGKEDWNPNGFSTARYFRDRPNLIIFNTQDEPRRFRKGISFNELIYWGDVSVCSLQILYLLGYETVLLLGCDCNYKEGEIAGVEKRGVEYHSSADSDPNHFRPDYFGKGTVYSHPNRQGHFSSWQQIAKDLKATNAMTVYSGSEISTLNRKVFQYLSFSEFVKL